ncbi:transcription regulator protein BACH1b [Chanos chanos]|uniref:Transcription regulator protein BACH1b n=1 Tax=Chanos chanos TaxID=29144 RepID=A0A6J2WWI2_CHACN|nr:transcription regulator protein BACH1 [Chanos chanos]
MTRGRNNTILLTMSPESSRSSVFTFQSAVHTSHVLKCLDEQRKRDILCDVTVVVEGRSFRAHRSVLASCSDYFSARVSNREDQGLVISLPDEVTIEGFEPLLQFAYTAKLLFTKENVLEIRSCAAFLGFKNLENACFDFLLPKFFDNKKSTSKIQRKACCKSKCWKSNPDEPKTSPAADDDLDKPTASLISSTLRAEAEASCSAPSLTEDATGSFTSTLPENNTKPNYTERCPKYRKFQMAYGKDREFLDACGSQVNALSLAAADEDCPLNFMPCPGAGEDEDSTLSSFSKTHVQVENEDTMESDCSLSKPSLCDLPKAPYSSQISGIGCGGCISLECAPVDGSEIRETTEKVEISVKASRSMEPTDSNVSCLSMTGCSMQSSKTSSVEREVAEHLAKGFWSDVSTSNASPPFQGTVARPSLGKTPDSQWLKQTEFCPGVVDCPFQQDLQAMDAQLPGTEGASKSEDSPCVSSHQSGEDSDSFDTEGENESYARERAREVQLPFPVDCIASLSRNDFQQMLKLQHLTREQLDFLHDIRRRSKNRIAARRCRKRKLDCIHNLECEIEKLKSEKDKLMEERNQLNQMKLQAWQNFTGLYERVCTEAALRPEQLQVLAKYASPECPLSTLMTPTADPSLQPELQIQTPQPIAGCCSGLPVETFSDQENSTRCSAGKPGLYEKQLTPPASSLPAPTTVPSTLPE